MVSADSAAPSTAGAGCLPATVEVAPSRPGPRTLRPALSTGWLLTKTSSSGVGGRSLAWGTPTVANGCAAVSNSGASSSGLAWGGRASARSNASRNAGSAGGLRPKCSRAPAVAGPGSACLATSGECVGFEMIMVMAVTPEFTAPPGRWQPGIGPWAGVSECNQTLVSSVVGIRCAWAASRWRCRRGRCCTSGQSTAWSLCSEASWPQ